MKPEVEAIKALAVKPGSRKELARDFWLFHITPTDAISKTSYT